MPAPEGGRRADSRMTVPFEVPWSLEPCCDLRVRILVARICDDCDLIAGVIGLFTTRLDALDAHQSALDDRAVRYLLDVAPNALTLAGTRPHSDQ